MTSYVKSWQAYINIKPSLDLSEIENVYQISSKYEVSSHIFS